MMKVLPFDERTQVVPFDEQKDNVDTLIIANLSPDMNGDGDRSPRSDRKAHAETHSTVFAPRCGAGRVDEWERFVWERIKASAIKRATTRPLSSISLPDSRRLSRAVAHRCHGTGCGPRRRRSAQQRRAFHRH